MIFQEPMSSLSPVHTIGSQIMEAILLHLPVTKEEARKRAVSLLDLVGIPRASEQLDAHSFELSGGMRQRAMIAIALACEPQLLIADEPTTALDVTTQANILDLIRDLQQEYGMSVLFITHDLGVVAEIADEVAVMYLGRDVESGTVDAIFHDPKHPYTKALLQSIPRYDSRGQKRLYSIKGTVPHPFDRPAGCPFHPRCDEFIAEQCNRIDPPRHHPVPDHSVRCLLYPATDEPITDRKGCANLSDQSDSEPNANGLRPLLEVRSLHMQFPIRRGLFRRTVGYVKAVNDVSFGIQPGETLSLVGESGCGKTTTGRCIARVYAPTSGQILYRVEADVKLSIWRNWTTGNCGRTGAKFG